MARTITQIQDEILANKAGEPLLDGLSSTSESSIWRLWTRIVAAAIWAVEVLFDTHSAEIEERIKQNIPGTASWYVARAYEYQLGDTLEVINGRLAYAVVDESKKIIKRASMFVDPSNGTARLKVAKEDSGELLKLSTLERTAFNAYIHRLMFAGSFIQVFSLDSDKLQAYVSVYYDPIYLETDVKARVLEAINTWLASVPFDGFFIKIRLVDAIQAVAGVKDVKVTAFRGRANDSSVFTDIDLEYQAQAGYAVIDSAHPLSTSVTMIPKL